MLEVQRCKKLWHLKAPSGTKLRTRGFEVCVCRRRMKWSPGGQLLMRVCRQETPSVELVRGSE